MGLLYVNENGAVIGVEANQCTVTYKDGMKRRIPIESLEAITIMGQSQMTTQCAEECMERGISVSYFSKGGRYFGRLISTGHVNTERQRKQSALYDTEFAVKIGKKILNAKIKNQSVVLKRYEKSKGITLNEEQKMMNICRNKVLECQKISEMIGFEGQAAKYYFKGLSECIDKQFYFQGRSKRPPRDEFNSMISLGYSILMNEVYCKIEMKGLNPFFGFIHRDAEKHPTLASDLMEEWRPIIVDNTLMELIRNGKLLLSHFENKDQDFILTDEGREIFARALRSRILEVHQYIELDKKRYSFLYTADRQIKSLIRAFRERDPSLYETSYTGGH